MRVNTFTGPGWYVHDTEDDVIAGPFPTASEAAWYGRRWVDNDDCEPSDVVIFRMTEVLKLPESLDHNGE